MLVHSDLLLISSSPSFQDISIRKIHVLVFPAQSPALDLLAGLWVYDRTHDNHIIIVLMFSSAALKALAGFVVVSIAINSHSFFTFPFWEYRTMGFAPIWRVVTRAIAPYNIETHTQPQDLRLKPCF
jgi:hypothetical protein